MRKPEYRKQHHAVLHQASRIVVLGGGLIGTELAMDLHRAGKKVLLVERADGLLASLMPAELSSRLQQKCRKIGIQLSLNNAMAAVSKTAERLSVRLKNGLEVQTDAVIAAVGLRPNVVLAVEAGLW